MATVKIDLDDKTWHDLGSTAIALTKGTGDVIEVVNADAAPTGNIENSMQLGESELQVLPAPLSGNYYVKAVTQTSIIKYHGVK